MFLTTKGRYAIIATVDMVKILSKEERSISVHEIANKQKISTPYLEQIFLKLKNGGILESRKGPGGGYKLAKKPSDVFLIDIIDAVGERIKMTKCDECRSVGRVSGLIKCDTHDLWSALSVHIRSYFEKKSLADAANSSMNDEVFLKTSCSNND